MPSSPGRPRLASKELLQEAAFELFQLRGYRRVSVEQIARTAGFSRATFFNFFSSKAELFWVETDALIDALGESLEESLSLEPRRPLREALVHHASGLRSSDIPWALQNYRLLEADDALVASGASRVMRLRDLFLAYLRKSDRDESEPLTLAAEAAAMTGQVLVGVTAWIDAGVRRGELRTFLSLAL